MRFPLEWIRDFVEISEPPEVLADRLSGVGMVVDAVEGEGDAAVLEVDIPANRPDCMNIYGLAREIAAFTGKPLAPYSGEAPESSAEPAAAKSASVHIETGELCSRYCARIIRGIQVGVTPDHMAARLRAAGLNVVNNIVDVTNYVLWEYGHPLHAFDLAHLEGSRIIVRKARKGETLKTLDGLVRSLSPEMLVIADGSKPVAIAGVMGGADSMIDSGASGMLLESAHFNPVSVRKTSKALGLSTDASYRFERGANVEAAAVALNRAAALISDLSGGRIAPGILDIRAADAQPERQIHLRLSRAELMLGLAVDPAPARQGLEALGFQVKQGNDDTGGFLVTVPHHRQDVTLEADLVEEVARNIGYENIPESLPEIPGVGEIRRADHRREALLRDSLSASGFTEVLSLVFVSPEHEEIFSETGGACHRLANPLADGQDALRSTLFSGLLPAVRHNLNHGKRDLNIFEIGHVFSPGMSRAKGRDKNSEKDKNAPRENEMPLEPLMLGLVATGQARGRHWSESEADRAIGFYDIKGAIEEAAARLRIDIRFAGFEDALDGTGPFSRGSGGRILYKDKTVGRIGTLSGEAAEKVGIKSKVYMAEINLSILFSDDVPPLRLAPINRFPSASRDMALVVKQGTSWEEIAKTIRTAGGSIVSNVSVFDRYTGSSLPRDHASLAVNVIYVSNERTLEAEEVKDAEQKILTALQTEHAIILRT
jgi:phenylalanyl-tRNA synthetase beta chain